MEDVPKIRVLACDAMYAVITVRRNSVPLFGVNRRLFWDTNEDKVMPQVPLCYFYFNFPVRNVNSLLSELTMINGGYGSLLMWKIPQTPVVSVGIIASLLSIFYYVCFSFRGNILEAYSVALQDFAEVFSNPCRDGSRIR